MDNNFEQDDGDEIVEDDLVDSDVIMDDAIELDENDYFEPAAHLMFLNEAGINLSGGETDDAAEMGGSSGGAGRGEASPDDFSLANLTAEQVSAINEFSLEKHTKDLCSKAGTGDLWTALNNHWRYFVPICLNALDTPARNLIDLKSDLILLRPLEVYLCNSLDSEKALGKLKEFDDPPQLCGKVFKAGEPSYFCRDCGSDPTCVLCSACFRRSKHREHRYKMMTSGGGGYCDCGDPEAWKEHPSCELHMPKSSGTTADIDSPDSAEASIQKLPNDLVQRATQLFQYLVEYVFPILSVENSEELPAHLRPETQVDDYVTMLYNDEVHSYDQVTTTLRKVLVIDDKKAFEYAAIVDKEGRSAIKRGKKVECDSIKNKVEQTMSGPITNALETKVMHHSLVAHQYFAEKLIVWMQKITEMSKGLKHILCKIGLFSKPDSHSVIEKFMLSDSCFWKSARAIMHQFFISVFFMDPYWKREFAILYTKNYKSVWRNHVKNPDDTVSLTDLAVQLFTVGSLAKHLIANQNLLANIMETLIEHCKTNKGKLSFPRTRHRVNPEFRRAQFILLDLKYSLTSVPSEWNDPLRKNFVAGFKAFVEFMKFMHGMDSLKRLTQQHIEYEPEWETSFNLLIKLQKSIHSLIEWCASDAQVFVECFKHLLHSIDELEQSDEQFKYKYEKLKCNSTSYEVIEYSVMRQEVSIHAPLTRLLAALYAHQRDDTSLVITSKMHGLIEPSLRALCLVCQTNNGFWKRNGFSLLSQVYFYSNIKCRFEMFDRDILCLQMGLSKMNPDEFLINLMSRYCLYPFMVDENFELPSATENTNLTDDKKLEYLLPMSEDFLELLIVLVSERYEPFMSQIDAITKMQREVIHQLCVSPMAHSDLVKNIYPDNEKYTNELESVLSRIATFKNSTSGKGVYELKEEYRSYYSPYFYHYSRTEKTKSEEYQMSLRKNESERFFSPPRLPPLKSLFANMSRLLDSDIFIKIIFCVLRRFVNKSKLATEGQLLRVLHLIGLALHEEQDEVDQSFSGEKLVQSEFKFLEKSTIQMSSGSGGTTSSSKKSTLLSSIAKTLSKSHSSSEDTHPQTLSKLLSEIHAQMSSNNAQVKLLIEWLLDYSHRLLKLKHKIDEHKLSGGVDEQSAAVVAAAAAAAAAAVTTNDEAMQKEKRKNQIAEKSRAKVMAKLNKMQKNFMENYKELYEETKGSVDSSPLLSSSLTTPSSLLNDVDMQRSPSQTGAFSWVVCIGPNQTQAATTTTTTSETKSYHCILCQDKDLLSFASPPMVLCCYVQASKVLSKNRADSIDTADFDAFDPLFVKSTLAWGINSTSCGHVMHATCWQKYVDTVRMADNRRHLRFLGFNIKRNEYLCPLCETIGNTVMPLFPDLRELAVKSPNETTKLGEEEEKTNESGGGSLVAAASIDKKKKKKRIELSYEDWLDALEKTLENSIKKELHDDKDVFIINPCPLSTITKLMATAVASNFRLLFEFDYSASMTNILSTASSSLTSSSSPPTLPPSASLSSPPREETAVASSSSGSALAPSVNNTKLNSDTVSTIENFTRASFVFGFSTFPNDDDARMPISMWINCAYTIQVIEQLLAFESKPLFGHFSVKQLDLLSNIVKQAALYGMTKNTESVSKHCVRLLALILPYNKTALVDESRSLLEIDLFHYLVALCLAMPNLYEDNHPPKLSRVPSGGLNDFNVFKLVLQAHCVQILLSKIKYANNNNGDDQAYEMIDEDETSEHVSRDHECVYEFFEYLLASGCEKSIFKLSEEEKSRLLSTRLTKSQVYATLVRGSMPFLRSSALFFSNLTNLTPNVRIEDNVVGFYELLKFLGVSDGLKEIIDIKSNSLKILCNSWLSVIASKNEEKVIKIEYPRPLNKFIELPNDYVDLISMSMPPHVCSSRTSSLMDASAESATILCLICGEMMCSQPYCCPKEIFKKRVGCCTAHAFECSGSVGVFLRVAECQVLLMQLNINNQDDMQVRGCFVPAPYLDDYGETDQGLRRGNPLHLCQIRYNKLYKDWLSHAIPEEISRSSQNQSNHLNINWIEF